MHEDLDRAEEIKLSSDRSFGIVFLLVFLAMGIWMVLGSHPEGWLFLAGSVILFVVTLARPSILSPLNRAWFKFDSSSVKWSIPLYWGSFFSSYHPHGGYPETIRQGFASP